MAGKDATLAAKRDVSLGNVKECAYKHTKKKTLGFLTKKTVTKESLSTTEVGSLVDATNNLVISSGQDLSVAETVSGGQDVTLTAANKITTAGMDNASHDYYKKKKSGLLFKLGGGKALVVFGKQKQSTTDDRNTIAPTEIEAEKGDLNITSGNAAHLSGTDLSAGHDLIISGSSVGFDALSNVSRDIKKTSSTFMELSVGLSGSSLVGQAINSALAAEPERS